MPKENGSKSSSEHVVHVPSASESVVVETGAMPEEGPSIPDKLKTLLIGKPRDLADKSVFTHISLVAFLAWVGLGADGLSSSCYGPAEAFRALGEHSYLAVFLALAIVATVLIISTCYSHIIEEFPSGGGGYLVASKLLGSRVGVVSGCALLVDYVLTITVSIAAAGDAMFGLIAPLNSATEPILTHWPILSGLTWGDLQLYAEFAAILMLIDPESPRRERIDPVTVADLPPVSDHARLTDCRGSVCMHLPGVANVAGDVTMKFQDGLARSETRTDGHDSLAA